jgi:hypothetical protein
LTFWTGRGGVRHPIIGCTLSLALLSACHGPKEASAETSATPGAEKPGDPKGYLLTREKLAAYLRYQSLKTREAVDAGSEQQGLILEHSRTEAGLSVRDLEEMEAMIPRVIGKRAFARQLADEKSLETLESVKAKVPLHHQKQLEHLVGWNKAQRAEALGLAEERQRYGNANVDLILSQEAELLRIWDSEIAQLTR